MVGLVRVNNIREFHFSRNPKLVELLGEYDLVKEFGEGVDRIYRDMEKAGLPKPIYKQSDFMLSAELRNKCYGEAPGTGWDVGDTHQVTHQDTHQVTDQDIIEFCIEPKSRMELMDFVGLKDKVNFRRKYLKPLLDSGRIVMTIPDKPNSKNQKYVAVKK